MLGHLKTSWDFCSKTWCYYIGLVWFQTCHYVVLVAIPDFFFVFWGQSLRETFKEMPTCKEKPRELAPVQSHVLMESCHQPKPSLISNMSIVALIPILHRKQNLVINFIMFIIGLSPCRCCYMYKNVLTGGLGWN